MNDTKHDDNLFLLRDPGWDDQDVEAELRAALAERGDELPELACVHGRAELARQRQTLRKTIEELQERILDCGLVATHRQGWLGRLEMFFKRRTRGIVARHLLQQHRVHLRLLTLLSRLMTYLDEQDQLLRVCIDRAEDRCARRSEPAPCLPRTRVPPK